MKEIEYTHFTMRLKRTQLDKLKEIARLETVKRGEVISAAHLIREVIKRKYPQVFNEEKVEGQTSL